MCAARTHAYLEKESRKKKYILGFFPNNLEEDVNQCGKCKKSLSSFDSVVVFVCPAHSIVS